MNDKNRKKHKPPVRTGVVKVAAGPAPEWQGGAADSEADLSATVDSNAAAESRAADASAAAGEAWASSDAPVATEDEWRAALETAVKQRDEYLNLAQRVQADFQNYKRRNEKTRADGYDDGVRELLTALLPAFDNFERAVKACEEQPECAALLSGVRMIDRQLQEAAAAFGMEEVPALGQPFDPELHNAVMRAEEGEPGTVIEVFQKGYRARGRMIRYAMVKVAAE